MALTADVPIFGRPEPDRVVRHGHDVFAYFEDAIFRRGVGMVAWRRYDGHSVDLVAARRVRGDDA